MKVVSPADFSHVTPLGRPVEKGEEIEVDPTLGAQLCAQGWTTKSKPAKPAGKPTETAAPAATEEQ